MSDTLLDVRNLHVTFDTPRGAVEAVRGISFTVGRERVGRLILDGDVILPADGATMGERRRIAAHGMISVAVALDSAFSSV